MLAGSSPLEFADLEDMRGAHVWVDLDEVAGALPGVFGFIRIVEIAHGESVVLTEAEVLGWQVDEAALCVLPVHADDDEDLIRAIPVLLEVAEYFLGAASFAAIRIRIIWLFK